MIAMQCPGCGAEGRIPNEKVNIRLVCKRCFGSFHLTPAGKVVAGSPPVAYAAGRHEDDGHDMDVVDHEIQVVLGGLKTAAPKVAAAVTIAIAAVMGWKMIGWGKVASLDHQAAHIAKAFVKNDVPALRALAVEGTDDEATELWQALLPELIRHSDILQAVSPAVDVARLPDAPGPGLSQVIASIRTDQPVDRLGLTTPDVSTGMASSGSVELPLVLAGDDHKGWRLDGERTLEAYRKSRAPSTMGRAGRSGAAPASPPATGGPKPAPATETVAAPRA